MARRRLGLVPLSDLNRNAPLGLPTPSKPAFKAAHDKRRGAAPFDVTCEVQGPIPATGPVRFTLTITCCTSNDPSWKISRRFSDFIELHELLSASPRVTARLPPLPPRRVRREASRMRERAFALARFSNEILSLRYGATNQPEVAAFFQFEPGRWNAAPSLHSASLYFDPCLWHGSAAAEAEAAEVAVEVAAEVEAEAAAAVAAAAAEAVAEEAGTEAAAAPEVAGLVTPPETKVAAVWDEVAAKETPEVEVAAEVVQDEAETAGMMCEGMDGGAGETPFPSDRLVFNSRGERVVLKNNRDARCADLIDAVLEAFEDMGHSDVQLEGERTRLEHDPDYFDYYVAGLPNWHSRGSLLVVSQPETAADGTEEQAPHFTPGGTAEGIYEPFDPSRPDTAISAEGGYEPFDPLLGQGGIISADASMADMCLIEASSVPEASWTSRRRAVNSRYASWYVDAESSPATEASSEEQADVENELVSPWSGARTSIGASADGGSPTHESPALSDAITLPLDDVNKPSTDIDAQQAGEMELLLDEEGNEPCLTKAVCGLLDLFKAHGEGI